MLNFLKGYINSKPLKMITYHEYINLALYHPQYGYYMKEKEKIGKNGDFYTASNLADIMGKVIAKWYARTADKYSLSPSVCEMGAGTGRFAKAFFEGWMEVSQRELSYIILEKSPYHRKVQGVQLDSRMNVQYIKGIEELDGFNGLIFSNELLDAFPVHVIEKQDGRLYEVMIAYSDGQLVEKRAVLSDDRIHDFLNKYRISLYNGQRIEIPLFMEDLIRQISQVFVKGLIVTIDYGYTKAEWSDPLRKDGSLRGYSQHQMMNNVLMNPGEMDITSHIHWEVLEELGEQYQLQKVGRWKQNDYLMNIGMLNELIDHQDNDPFSEVNKHNRAIRSLMMSEGISHSFHVLLQNKGVDMN